MNSLRIYTLCLVWLLSLGGMTFAQTQTFDGRTIPQTIITTAKTASECYNNMSYAMYNGQGLSFSSMLSSVQKENMLRIIYTATGQDGIYYPNGAPDSTKTLIYNPYGSLSAFHTYVGPNSFVSDFLFKSYIKPMNVESVYVGAQDTPTYTFAGVGNMRGNIAGQVIHNIRRRSPATIFEGKGIDYRYTLYPSHILEKKKLLLTFKSGDGRERTDQGRYLCSNVYVGYCGDGIIDKPTGENTTDGQGGIQTKDVGFVKWFIPTFKSELCDSGALNDDTIPGACKKDCSGLVPNNQSKASCEIITPLSGIYLDTTWTIDWIITGSYTNIPSITADPTNITGLPFDISRKSGSTLVIPQWTGAYTVSLALNSAAGATTCTGNITITYCGDGILDGNNDEVCDAGADNGSDLCTTICTIPPIDSPVDEAVLQ